MTLAVAKAIMEAARSKRCQTEDDRDYHALLSSLTVKSIQEIRYKYPNCEFGGMFYRWVFSASRTYNSFGNGAAMRLARWVLLRPAVGGGTTRRNGDRRYSQPR